MENHNIIISNPCFEDWSKMTPTSKGKHCDSCCKTVVDFTRMNDLEIKQYFIDKTLKKDSICGHLKSTQAEIKRPKHHQFLVDLQSRIEKNVRYSKLKTVGLAAVAICMGLVGCNQPVNTSVPIGNTEESTDTNITNHLLGAVLQDSDSTQREVRMGKVVKETFKDSANVKTCSVLDDSTQTFNVLMGEIATRTPTQNDTYETTTGEIMIEK